MQFSAVFAIASLAASVSAGAIPKLGGDHSAGELLCYGLPGTPQCCATDVAGVVDLDCASPTEKPANVDDFTSICAKGGQRPRCCFLPVVGQALICDEPIPGKDHGHKDHGDKDGSWQNWSAAPTTTTTTAASTWATWSAKPTTTTTTAASTWATWNSKPTGYGGY